MSFLSNFRRVTEPVRSHPRPFLESSLESLILGLGMIATIECTERLLRSLGNHITPWIALGSIALVLLIVSVARLLLLKTGWGKISLFGTSREMHRFLESYVHADITTTEKVGTGQYLRLVDRGTNQWMDMLFVLSYFWVYNACLIIYALYRVFLVDVRIGWFFVLLFTLAIAGSTYANYWMSEKRKLRAMKQKEAHHQFTIALMSKAELMQTGWLSRILDRIDRAFQEAFLAHIDVAKAFLAMEEIPKYLFFLGKSTLYLLVSTQVLASGDGSILTLSIIITVFALAEKALNDLLHQLRDMLREFSHVELYWQAYDGLGTPEWEEEKKVYRKRARTKIHLKNITYAYGNEETVLDSIDLSISSGDRIALVGPSGGGKSTLLRVIAGYLTPESGGVSIFGNDLSHTSLETYLPNVWYLTQEPSVFDASIRENLLSTKPNASEEELQKALELAECDFVWEFELGLDTEIGERGVRLSGWQKQRLAIAKIFLKNPDIILLDEPTAALDSQSEAKITAALDRLFQGKTIIIIAHRLQTVRNVDQIYLIQDGKIRDHGTHEELSEKEGPYREMIELQSWGTPIFL